MSSRVFISNVRKFVRVPSKEVYNSLLYFLQEDLNAKDVRSEEQTMLITAKLRGAIKAIGFTVHVRILPESEASTIELSFSYRGFLAIAVALLVIMIVLSIAFFSMVPFVGVILLFMLIHDLSSSSGAFLGSVNDFLLLLERDQDQKLLAESRKRWQADMRKLDILYGRLLDKHVRVWGDAHVLEYKISEYMRIGLTKEEAVRKVADEEGVL